MKKIYGIASLFVAGVLLTGCDGGAKTVVATTPQIKLTTKEKKLSQDEAARILVFKALQEEVKQAEFSPEELENIKAAQEQVKINYFVEKELKDKIQIKDGEVAEFYKKHREEFDSKTLEELLPILYQSLAIEKYNQAQVEYYNGIIEKYKLNDILVNEGIVKPADIAGKGVEKI